jgi:flavin-dependent dehydrogenase
VDKACGEGLMPGAVSAHSDLGVPPAGQPIRGIRYTDGRCHADAYFQTRPGLGVRRTTLQSELYRAVIRAGIPVIHRKVDRIEQNGSSVSAGGLTGRYLAAADGLHSPIRHQLGLHVEDSRPRRFGLRRHFSMPAWTDLVEVHWSAGAEAYVTPVAADLVGVAILSENRAGFDDQLRRFPELVVRLPTAAATDSRGAGPLRQRVRARVAGRVMLVGDASGYVDALTGEGIAVAMASASALVDSVLRGRPHDYERAWVRVSRRYRWLTESLLWIRGRPLLARALVPAASRLPRAFTAAVGQLAR